MIGIVIRILVLVLAILVVRWLLKGPTRVRNKSFGAGRDMDELVAITRGDPAKALQLMASETKRDPEINEREAVRRAIERFRRDNR